jgi:hypothetical protein
MSEIDREKLAKARYKMNYPNNRWEDLEDCFQRDWLITTDKLIEYYNEPEPSIQAAIDLLKPFAEPPYVVDAYKLTKAIEMLEKIPKENVLEKYRKELQSHAEHVMAVFTQDTTAFDLAELVRDLLEESCQT